jgi:hypothetical protein
MSIILPLIGQLLKLVPDLNQIGAHGVATMSHHKRGSCAAGDRQDTGSAHLVDHGEQLIPGAPGKSDVEFVKFEWGCISEEADEGRTQRHRFTLHEGCSIHGQDNPFAVAVWSWNPRSPYSGAQTIRSAGSDKPRRRGIDG